MTDTTHKREIQKLQRILVDALEDVKAKDIRVFNTESLTPLFERVLIATATSNRQTRALAASVRDAMRDHDMDKPRIEGEDNGEWVIVDCGSAVVHIMQAEIRQYYRLEEIWGETPVRVRLGKPASSPARAQGQGVAAKKTSRAKPTAEGSEAPKPKPARKAAAKKSTTSGPAAKRAPAKKAARKTPRA